MNFGRSRFTRKKNKDPDVDDRAYEEPWPKREEPPPVCQALQLTVEGHLLKVIFAAVPRKYAGIVPAGVVRHAMQTWGLDIPADISNAPYSLPVHLELGHKSSTAPEPISSPKDKQKNKAFEPRTESEQSFSTHQQPLTLETLQYVLPSCDYASPQQQLINAAADELMKLQAAVDTTFSRTGSIKQGQYANKQCNPAPWVPFQSSPAKRGGLGFTTTFQQRRQPDLVPSVITPTAAAASTQHTLRHAAAIQVPSIQSSKRSQHQNCHDHSPQHNQPLQHVPQQQVTSACAHKPAAVAAAESRRQQQDQWYAEKPSSQWLLTEDNKPYLCLSTDYARQFTVEADGLSIPGRLGCTAAVAAGHEQAQLSMQLEQASKELMELEVMYRKRRSASGPINEQSGEEWQQQMAGHIATAKQRVFELQAEHAAAANRVELYAIAGQSFGAERNKIGEEQLLLKQQAVMLTRSAATAFRIGSAVTGHGH